MEKITLFYAQRKFNTLSCWFFLKFGIIFTKGMLSQMNWTTLPSKNRLTNERHHILGLCTLRLQCGTLIHLLAWFGFQSFLVFQTTSKQFCSRGAGVAELKLLLTCVVSARLSRSYFLFCVRVCFFTKRGSQWYVTVLKPQEMGSVTRTILPSVFLIFVHSFYGTSLTEGGLERVAGWWFILTLQHRYTKNVTPLSSYSH